MAASKALHDYYIQEAILQRCDSPTLANTSRSAKLLYEPCQQLLWQGYEPSGPFLWKADVSDPDDWHCFDVFKTPDLGTLDRLATHFPTQLRRWLRYVKYLALDENEAYDPDGRAEHACLLTKIDVWAECHPRAVRIVRFDVGLLSILPGCCGANLRSLVVIGSHESEHTKTLLDTIDMIRCPDLRALAVKTRYWDDSKDSLAVAALKALLDRQTSISHLQLHHEGRQALPHSTMEHMVASILARPNLRSVVFSGATRRFQLNIDLLRSLLEERARPRQSSPANLGIPLKIHVSMLRHLPLPHLRAIELDMSYYFAKDSIWAVTLSACHQLEHVKLRETYVRAFDYVTFANATPLLKTVEIRGAFQASEFPPMPAAAFLQILRSWPRLRLYRVDAPFEDIPANFFYQALAACPLLYHLHTDSVIDIVPNDDDDVDEQGSLSLQRLVVRQIIDRSGTSEDDDTPRRMPKSYFDRLVNEAVDSVRNALPLLESLYCFETTNFARAVGLAIAKHWTYVLQDQDFPDGVDVWRRKRAYTESLKAYQGELRRRDDEQHTPLATTLWRETFLA